MRRGLFFVLMVVLVLRGLTGTAMAVGVLPPLLPTGALHAQEHSHRHATPEAYATSAEIQTDGAAQATDAGIQGNAHTTAHHDDHSAQDAVAGCVEHDHHTASCSACEICHSAVLGSSSATPFAHCCRGAALPTAAAQFDRAPAALSIKPPIA